MPACRLIPAGLFCLLSLRGSFFPERMISMLQPANNPETARPPPAGKTETHDEQQKGREI